jgi:hypothetical protein
MRQPEMYSASLIKKWDVDQQSESGEWIPARPIGTNIWPWTWRWKLAWDVLTGKCDALNWCDD